MNFSERFQKNLTKNGLSKFLLIFRCYCFIDIGAYLNCIREGIIPTKYFKKTKEKLSSVDSSNLKIQYEIPNVLLEIQNQFYKINFVVVKNLMKDLILESPFINQLKPFLVVNEGIITIKE